MDSFEDIFEGIEITVENMGMWDDGMMMHRMANFMYGLDDEVIENLNDNMLKEYIEITEELANADDDDEEEVEEALAAKKKYIDKSERLKRKKEYRQKKSKLKLQARKRRKTAAYQKYIKRAKRMAALGKTATGKRQTTIAN